ncbi:hypothetical protein INR49_023242 [Caranx melampygus]|nr:hypothetical protein INR49_023242 [Caranx melampygus]
MWWHQRARLRSWNQEPPRLLPPPSVSQSTGMLIKLIPETRAGDACAGPAHFCEPRRHHCILGHFYEQHRPSDHYFLDQAVHMFPRHVSFQVEEEEIIRINPRERTWLTGYEDYRHANSTRDKLTQPDNPSTYVHFTKSEPPKHEYTYPYPLGCDMQRGCNGKPGCWSWAAAAGRW